MPATNPDAVKRKRAKDNERRREQRANPDYREAERKKDAERKRQERRLDRGVNQYLHEALGEFVDDWEACGWIDGYISKRGGIEAYRPWLEMLYQSDLERRTARLSVYKTSPLAVDERATLPRVWQTYRSATIQIPSLPLIKRFKILDPKDPDPIPIGEGELVRRYLNTFAKGRWVFPKSDYGKVVEAPKYFMPMNPPDMLEFDVEYVDIARCYSQLLERLPSLAIRFNYGKRSFEPTDLPSYDRSLLVSKHWGRAIVGMLRQPKGRYFVYGVPKTFPSRYFHGDTSSWVHAILHNLASYAVGHCGCFRWHTDGGFFPYGGGSKFSRLLNDLGIVHTLERYSAVLFASLDQYEAIRLDGGVKQTKLFTSTYVDDYVFLPANQGGGQRNNIIEGLDESWLYSTLEKA